MKCMVTFVLFCSLLKPIDVKAEMQQVFGASGSSISLESGQGDNLRGREIVWEFTGSDGLLYTIVDDGPDHAMAKPNKHFEGRLRFNHSSGDLLLSNLSTSDQGNYTISLDGNLQRTISVQIIDKLSRPSIQGRSGCFGSTSQLTCQVTGNPHAIQWRKDGGELPRHYQLRDRNGTLVIPSASKGDSGNYTCVASNPVTSVQADYTLTILGLSVDDAAIAAELNVAVVFSSVNLIASLATCCWKMKSGKELPGCKYWMPFQFICNIVPFIAFLTAIFRRNVIKGSGSLPVIAACLVILLVSILIRQFAVQLPKCRRTCRCQRRMDVWNLFLPGLHATLIVISVAFWSKEIHQNNQGCNVEIWSLLLTAKVECAIIILVSLMSYCLGRNKSQTESSSLNKQQLHGEVHELEILGPSHKAEPQSLQLV